MNAHRRKVSVVDDDRSARMLAMALLQEEARYEVREFDSGEALLAVSDEAPDIVLLDIEMAGINGIETCRRFNLHGGPLTVKTLPLVRLTFWGLMRSHRPIRPHGKSCP